MLSAIYEIVNINTFYPGIVREREDRFDLKSPTLFIFAENDAVIPLDQVSWGQSTIYSIIVLSRSWFINAIVRIMLHG